ncbi:Feline leukemia virus subgroup C receptor-related protein 2 [Nymphon striatum]|nr:Feline leukemia virus subgroup C receptor-related protein 2 [Nymphon striatum]
MVEELRTASNKVSLEINLSKTKVMFNRNVEIQPIMTGNVALDQVDRYIYLGQLISIHRDWEPEVRRRVDLEKKGMRICLIVGAFLNCFAAWIKCGSVDPSRYYVTLIGQILAATSQLFILGIPPQLAASWFSERDVSRACAVGVFGNQVGIALGFLIPPMVVTFSEDKDEISSGLNVMFYTIAVLTTIIFFCILFGFQNAPPNPPSKAQAATLGNIHVTSYKASICNLVKNRSYVLLVISYGINTGIFYAISTLLNQALEMHYQGQETTIGQIGLTIVVAGLIGSVVGGFVLDKTHRFKETTLGTYFLCLLAMFAYTFTIQLHEIALVFVTAGGLGFFMTGYLPVGFEFAAEITYPEPEGTSSGFLNASAQVFGIILTLGGSALLVEHGDLGCHIFFCLVLIAGLLMTAFIQSDLRRQRAGKSVPNADGEEQTI